MNSNDIVNLISSSSKHHEVLKKQAHQAGFLGGIQVAGFGIPNQFLGLDLRTGAQKAAQYEPAHYMRQMSELIKKLDEMLDIAQAPVGSRSK